MSDAELIAFTRGQHAHICRLPKTSNPFEQGLEYEAWNAGWEDEEQWANKIDE